jgi:hypothetical protein
MEKVKTTPTPPKNPDAIENSACNRTYRHIHFLPWAQPLLLKAKALNLVKVDPSLHGGDVVCGDPRDGLVCGVVRFVERQRVLPRDNLCQPTKVQNPSSLLPHTQPRPTLTYCCSGENFQGMDELVSALK